MKYEFDSVAEYYVGSIIKSLLVAVIVIVAFTWALI